MKVRLKSPTESNLRRFDQGCDLDVLALSSHHALGSSYLIWSERKQVAILHPAKNFEVVNGELSPLWRASLDLNGFVELAPAEFLEDGFWDRYHEDDPAANRTFADVYAKLTGRPLPAT